MNETPAPTIQINNPPNPHSQDHDLLIQIDTKLGRALDDIKTLSGNMTTLSDSKVSQKDFEDYKREREKDFTEYRKSVQETLDDFEQRLRFVTKWLYYGFGFVAAIDAFLFVYQIYKTFHP